MALFGKKDISDSTLANGPAVTPEPETPKGYTAAKGAPTPRRKDVEAKNRRPLVGDTSSMTKDEKKVRKAEQRAKSNEMYAKGQEAMRTGDDRNMPIQHKGPVRRYARDYIDASHNLGAGIFGIFLLILPLIMLQSVNPTAITIAIIAIYAIAILMFLHSIWLVRKVKKKVIEKFGEGSVPKGFFFQMLGRTFYPRRWRMPKSQVRPGEFPA